MNLADKYTKRKKNTVTPGEKLESQLNIWYPVVAQIIEVNVMEDPGYKV